MTAPGFLVIGHAAQDVQPDGSWKLGGAVAYAAALARNLGLRAAALTSASPDVDFARLLPDVETRVVPARTSTRFHNRYENGVRRQSVSGRAAPLSAADLPDDWRRAPVVLLGPLVGELDERIAAHFPDSIVGVGAQGWLREIASDGTVSPVAPERWNADPLLARAAALFVSDEDIPAESAADAIRRWLRTAGIVAFTHGDRGAEVHVAPASPFAPANRRGGASVLHIPAFPANVVDLTGAGDIFAAAFLIRLHEKKDVAEAARFASCAASFVVEGEGLSGVPDREGIEARLRDHPEIVAQASPPR